MHSVTATLLPRPAGSGLPAGTGRLTGWSVAGALVGGFALSSLFVAPTLGLLGLVGLPIAAVALVKAVDRPGLAATGAALNAVSIVLTVSLLLAGTPAAPAAAGAGAPTAFPAAGPPASVVYEVEGAGTGQRIAYSVVRDGTLVPASAQAAALPWRTEFSAPTGGTADDIVYSVTATSGPAPAPAASTADSGRILCRITVNGLLLSQQVRSGSGATVRCAATNLRGLPGA